MNLCLRSVVPAVLVVVPVGPALAQSFANAASHIPATGGYTENVDFADVDGDGDSDALLAEGGDAGNDRNELWINRGFEPGGTIGFFADRTAAQCPNVLDASRDVDFVDFDADGDPDVLVTNSSSTAFQSNRFWVNMGGAQGGTPGFFQDQTASRWTFIAVNDGVSHFSSIAPSVALGSGGFMDWSCDAVCGDLDGDGAMDVFHSSYGGNFIGNVPSRVFLNDGAGFFEEFNPSHFQLAGAHIANGDPALWCQGVQLAGATDTSGAQTDISDTPLGVELGDLDGDLDLDVLQGARNEMPRHYRNLSAGGVLAFRDVTYASGYTASVTGGGNYEQELGDFDADGDLDLYGVNWPGFDDCTLRNNGSGVFGSPFTLPGSGHDDNEADFIDYDADGDLDVFVSAFSGQDQLFRNNGSPTWSFAHVTAAQLPPLFMRSLGADGRDVDLDGDYDLLVAEDSDINELFLENITQIADVTAPRAEHLEQAPNRAAGPPPTVVRVHVYDNSSWDVARHDTVSVEYSWNAGADWHSAPMRYGGGQLFRGEIRGDIAGTIDYRVRASDEHGNVGLSGVKSYVATGCTGNVFTYCTAGTTSSGCNASMGASGVPSVSAASGFVLTASNVEGGKLGLIFYGISGRTATQWGTGTSFVCVKPPVQRSPVTSAGGTPGQCDGAIALDWLAFLAANPTVLGASFSAGQAVDAQCWFRDPPAPKSTSLSDALEFVTCP